MVTPETGYETGTGQPGVDGDRSHDEGAVCLCCAEHRPAPLEHEWHHVRPLYLGGAKTAVGVPNENGVWLCPTAHTNVHELLRLMVRDGAEWPWRQVLDAYEPVVNRYCYLTAVTGFRWYVSGQWGA